MGHTDMKPSNQSTNEDAIRVSRKIDQHVKANGSLAAPPQATTIPDDDCDNTRSLSNALWSSDGLLSSTRLFQRSSSTPPIHAGMQQGRHEEAMRKGSNAYSLNHFSLHESVDENTQEEGPVDFGRHDLVMPMAKHSQRSWSAPPVPDNLDSVFTKRPSEHDDQRTDTLRFGKSELRGVAASWTEEGFEPEKSMPKTSVATISPFGSPTMGDRRHDMVRAANDQRLASSFPQRGYVPPAKRGNGPFLSLVDRVQEDFPRTPSPVFGCPGGLGVPPPDMIEHSMVGVMKHLHIDRSGRMPPSSLDMRPSVRGSERGYAPQGFQPHVLDLRPPHRTINQDGFVPPYPVAVPPGFQDPVPPRGPGLYGSPMPNDTRTGWPRGGNPSMYAGGHYPMTPMEYGQTPHSVRGSIKNDHYAPKYVGGVYSHIETPGRMYQGQAPMAYPPRGGYDVPDHHVYNFSQPSPVYRSKPSATRRHEYPVHPAHSYSATTLLEEFKSAAKADKWDLRTIQGHLVQFARDQTGSRFIQQQLEKGDDRSREEAFNEIFPMAISLMTDVFGNYVIQKFFDHGSNEQQRRLVGLMKKNMISLALQVYGCRVIQKALEVTQVEEQLLLIREMRGHVMKCVFDQNGNHVLQKCIEAASWKKCLNGPDDHRRVLGEDIQFIVDDFIGEAAVLSMHAYGCRVIQRILEHCSPHQIRPIVNEIIFKCRELVKDQFGNYVVQHVICHGEVDQRTIVMQAILPDVAKWSQHKYASNVVEACLDCANKEEISQIVDLILDCDDSGASCALLPMMKHMYGNYVVQKLLDRADHNDRQRIVRIIQHNADYLKRFTYGKHVLSRLEREGNSGSTNGRYNGRYD